MYPLLIIIIDSKTSRITCWTKNDKYIFLDILNSFQFIARLRIIANFFLCFWKLWNKSWTALIYYSFLLNKIKNIPITLLYGLSIYNKLDKMIYLVLHLQSDSKLYFLPENKKIIKIKIKFPLFSVFFIYLFRYSFLLNSQNNAKFKEKMLFLLSSNRNNSDPIVYRFMVIIYRSMIKNSK